jgi:hypothetical protein
MKNKLAIYLAGSIKKGHEKNEDSYWTEADISLLQKHLDKYTVCFLNPALRFDDLSDQDSVFGRDMLQVYCSDVVLVDARHRRGLGVGAEMMWAKVHKLPVITLAPKNSHYHKTEATVLNVHIKEWVHPFVHALSDALVENLDEAAMWIERFHSGKIKVKGAEYIESAMHHYKGSQLPQDAPMKEILHGCTKLKGKVDSLDVLNQIRENYSCT